MACAESVTPGHPDKIADLIADAIVDAALYENPLARVACEVMVSHKTVHICGEISNANPRLITLARDVLDAVVFSALDPEFHVDVDIQSQNIARAVECGGAGDQSIVYGYACDAPQGLPPEVVKAHNVSKFLWDLFQTGRGGPDGKVLVYPTGMFVSAHVPVGVSPHDSLYILPSTTVSTFQVGGPLADTGLTGRKTQADTYGSIARHGGGAFSGKDPTKIDRTGAYMARYVAKTLVTRFGLPEIEVCLAYGFGLDYPLYVESKPDDFGWYILENFDLRPEAIIERFQLRRPIYQQTTNFGHFGRPELPWEE